MFLEISQNSQESTCARDSFLIKLEACEFCEISKNTYFIEHLQETASVKKILEILLPNMNVIIILILSNILLQLSSPKREASRVSDLFSISPIFPPLKDSHREKAFSNKTVTLTKSMNMGIWVVGASNQLFIYGS